MCLDLLRVPDGHLEKILVNMDRQCGPCKGAELRKYRRFRYRPARAPVIQLRHPGGSGGQFRVKARNISARGLAFLHGAFVHTGTECEITLYTVDNEPILLPSRIVRCRHIEGHVHEVAAEFSQLIDLANFVVGSRLEPEQPVENTSPPYDAVLCVDDNVDDRDLLAYWLSRLNLHVHTASDTKTALELVAKVSFGAVITVLDLPDGSAAQLTEALRALRYTGPIFHLTTEEQRTATRPSERDSTPSLVKPYTLDQLSALLSKHLPRKDSSNPGAGLLVSDRWADGCMRPLILRYLERLEIRLRKIEESERAGDISGLAQLCREIRSSAKGYGYDAIGAVAHRIVHLQKTGAGMEGLRKPLCELLGLCREACAFRTRTFGRKGARD